MQARQRSKKVAMRSDSDEVMVDSDFTHVVPVKFNAPEPLHLAPDAPASLRDLILAVSKDDLALLLRINRKRVNLGVQEPKAVKFLSAIDASTPAPPGASLPSAQFKVPDHLHSAVATTLIDRTLDTRVQLLTALWQKELIRITAAQQAATDEVSAVGEACRAKLVSLFESDPILLSFQGSFDAMSYVERMHEHTLEYARSETARHHVKAKLESVRKAAAKATAAATDTATEVLPDARVAAAMREIALKAAKQVFKDAGSSVPAKPSAAAARKPTKNKNKQAAGGRRSASPSSGSVSSRASRESRKDTRKKVRFPRGSTPPSTRPTRSHSPKHVLPGAHRGKRTGGVNVRR